MKETIYKTRKNHLTTLLLAVVFVLASAASGWGQEAIHYWSFNAGENSELDAANNEPTSIPADIGDGVINHGLSFSAFGGTTTNAEPGYGGGSSFCPAGAVNNGESFEVVVSTEGFENIIFSFAAQRTPAGYDNNSIEVSADGGATWETVVDGLLLASSFALYTYDLTAVEETVNDNPNVIVRVTLDVDAVTGGGNNRYDNIKVSGTEKLPDDQVATPVFTPGTGTYYAPFDLEITSSTEDADIFYSMASDEGPWTPYDDGNRPIISETTTVWAYAEKAGMDNSIVASAVYTFPIEVASIEALQDVAVLGGLYRITGEVFMTYENDSRNQKYFQDELTGGRGIKIDDNGGFLTTVLNIGDGVKNLTGTIGNFNRMIQFIPAENQSPASAHSTGNTLTPLQLTLADIIDENNLITVAGQEISVYQSLLIKVEDLQFEQAGNFDNTVAFGELPISDPTASLVDIGDSDFGVIFRVEYANLDYNGDPIPQSPLGLTAIVDQRFANARIFARDWDDFDIPDPLFFVTPSSLTDLDYLVDDGPSGAQSFELTGINLDGTDVTVSAPDDFEVSEAGVRGFVATVTLTAYDGTAKTIWVRLKANLPAAEYDGNVTISGGGANDAEVAVSGEVTEPPVTEVPFETKFEVDGNWGGSGSGYQNRWYEDGGWFLYGENAIRGTQYRFGDSPYAMRERVLFTITNQAAVQGMTGFSLQLLDWMSTPSGNRNLNISFDGGTNWETLLTINKDWFDESQVYQEFVYYFDEAKDFDAEDFIISIGDGGTNNNNRIKIGQFKALDDDPPPPPAVFAPVFDLPAGTYFEDQTVFVSNYDDYEPDVTVYYTTDGNDPDNQGNVYDHSDGIELQDGNGAITLKAIAIRDGVPIKNGTEESDIVEAIYVFPKNVADIEALRASDEGDLYRVTNEATYIGGTSFRNTKFFQDDSGFGIQIDDPNPPVIITPYNIGDNVAELVGTLGSFEGQLQLAPAQDLGAPISSGNVIVPMERTLDELGFDDQSRLVKVKSVVFENAGGTFGGGGSRTPITDPSLVGFTGSFRNVIGESDINGSTIPQGGVNIVGFVQEAIVGGFNLASRSLDDFTELPVYNATKDTYYLTLQEAVDAADPGDRITFEGEFDELDATGSEVTLAPGSSAGCASFSGNFILSDTETLEIEINGGTPCSLFDQLDVAGTVDLGGANLKIKLGYNPKMNDEFEIIKAGNDITGLFAQGGVIKAVYVGAVEITFQIRYLPEVTKGNDDASVVLEVTGSEVLVGIPIGRWSLFLLMGLIAGFLAFRFLRP